MPRKSYWQKVLGLSSCTGIKQSFFPCLPARSRSGRQPGNRVPFLIYALIRHGGVAETSPTSKALRVPARTVRSCWVESAFVWMGLATNGGRGSVSVPYLSSRFQAMRGRRLTMPVEEKRCGYIGSSSNWRKCKVVGVKMRYFLFF